MKKLLLLILLLSTLSFAQFNQYPRPEEGVFTGGFGLNWIDGELHYNFRLQPEISFQNFGMGLDLNLDFNQNGELREENFNDFSDYISVIRYVRYGYKNDPVFIKLGALDYHTLGHGSIMYLYNNSPSYDQRKTGLVLDIDFGKAGFESVYSSFGEAGVIGLRGYVRPLQFSSVADIPILGNLEVGASFVSDFHDEAGVISGFYDTTNDDLVVSDDVGSISIFGFDLGLPLFRTPFTDILLYFDYTKIMDFGSGVATGVKFDFNGLGLVNLTAKLERRFNGDQYIPSYFNALYEVERLRVNHETGVLNSRARQLAQLVNGSDGYYGELGASVLGLFYVIGSYQRLDDDPESGILHIGTEIAPEDAPFIARASYDKVNIDTEESIFTLDDRSYLLFELGYKPYPFLIVSMVYHWTFTPVRDVDDNIIDYEAIKRIEPRISFVYPFDFRGGN